MGNGETGVGEMGVGEMGVGEMGVGETGTPPEIRANGVHVISSKPISSNRHIV